MKYRLEYTARFKKDYKLLLKRGYNESLIQEVVSLIANGTPYLLNISRTNLPGIIKIAGNVIYSQTGF